MSVKCQHCLELKWSGETPSMCCSHGKIKLPEVIDPPEALKTLIQGQTSDSKHFLDNIQKYNLAFHMTTFGCTRLVHLPGFMPTFKIQCQVYHRIGSLQPQQGEQAKFLQIYFMGDCHTGAQTRCRAVSVLREDIVLTLQEMLHGCNSYVQSFKTALDKMTLSEHRVVIRPDRAPAGEHAGRFNATVFDEVAVIIAGETSHPKDIVLEKKSSTIQRVCETHRSYDALQYPLLFCYGEDDYNFMLKQTDPASNCYTNKKITAMDFYAHRLMVRSNSPEIFSTSSWCACMRK